MIRMAYTNEEYEHMKVIVNQLADMDAKREFLLEEATQRWMEEACELYSAISRKIRKKQVSAEELEHELHDTLWGMTGLARLILQMLEQEKSD